jgi:hypothetical protein
VHSKRVNTLDELKARITAAVADVKVKRVKLSL